MAAWQGEEAQDKLRSGAADLAHAGKCSTQDATRVRRRVRDRLQLSPALQNKRFTSPSTAANNARDSLLKTAPARREKRKQRVRSGRDATHDVVAAWVLWRRVDAACAPHTSARRSPSAAKAINKHANIPRECHMTRSAAVPRVLRVFQLRARAAGGKTCATYLPYVLLYSWAWRERGEKGGGRRRREEGGTPCARAPSPHGRLFLRSRRRTFFSARFKCG